MPRIPTTDIERLKRTISLERLAEARGIELKRHGADLIGRCPFHDDKTPSLVTTPAKTLWHCLGACQAGGTVIDWVMKAEGVSFRSCRRAAAKRLLAFCCCGVLAAKRSTVKKLTMPLAREAEDAQLLVQVVDYYHQTLLQSPEAMQYLERRGIRSRWTQSTRSSSATRTAHSLSTGSQALPRTAIDAVLRTVYDQPRRLNGLVIHPHEPFAA